MYRKVSIIISIILVTAAAILTVQSSSPSSLSMLQPSYAQLCPDGSTPDASGNCPTLTTPADDEETAEAPLADDEETTQAPPPATTETPPPPATQAPPPATTETPPPPATQ